MRWIHLIPVVVLFGVIYGNRYMDNRLLSFSKPFDNDKNGDFQAENFLEFPSNVNFMPEIIRKDQVGYENDYSYQQNDDSKQRFPYIYKDLHDLPQGKMNKNDDTSNGHKSEAQTSLDQVGTDVFKELSMNSYAMPENLISSENDDELNIADRSQLSLPAISNFNVVDAYEDIVQDLKATKTKRGGTVSTIGCDCKIKNDLLDLGQRNFPRYLLNSVCQQQDASQATRCWRGICKPLEYKVKVLTFRTDHGQKDPTLAWLPDDLRQLWKFKTVTVAAGCFCAVG